MKMQEWLNSSIFNLDGWSPTWGSALMLVIFTIVAAFTYRFLIRRVMQTDFLRRDSSRKDRIKIVRDARITLVFVVLWAFFTFLKLDPLLFEGRGMNIHLTTVIFGILILFVARFLDLIINKVIVYNMYVHREYSSVDARSIEPQDQRMVAGKIVQYIVYVFAILILVNAFQLDYTLFQIQKEDYTFNFKVSNIFKIILIIMVARLLIWVVIQIVLYGYYRQKDINIGSQFAINQLLKYILYFIAIMLAFESAGIRMTLIWGGTAALLVGVGLGLQKTFNDFISGIILLFERTVEVGDVVAFGNTVGRVKKIGMRSSIVEVRDNTTLIVPNSDLVANKVENWSHSYKMARFDITVGVSYGTDTQLVKSLLLQAVKDNPHILDYPSPFVRFSDFGDSALVFNIYFYSKEMQIVEDVKSHVRFNIDTLFRENNIVVPFPQRDVWIREKGKDTKD